MSRPPAQFAPTQTELVAALKTLRLLVREVGHNYLTGLQAAVAQVERAVAAAREDDTPDAKQLAQFRRMLRWINNLDIQPSKGRRRDLKELDKLVRKLTDVMETW